MSHPPMLNPTDRLPSIIPTKFYIDYVHDANGTIREIEKVKWQRRGEQGSETIERIAHMKRDGGPKWEVISKYYEAWKANETPPVNGVPLERWADATPEFIKLLNELQLRTVEDFAAVNDGVMDRIHAPGVRALRDKARAWLESQKSLSSVHAENAALKAELAELRAMIEAKPKRGRPPKEVNEPSHDSQ
jgi:hypothetical protein